MKKLMKSCLAVAMVLALCLSLLPTTAFAQDDLYDLYEGWCQKCGQRTIYCEKSTIPTCTEPGEKHYRCMNCGDKYMKYVGEPTGHNFVDGECTNGGCDEKDPDYYVEPEQPPVEPEEHVHNFGDWVKQATSPENKQPTCTEDGIEVWIRTCQDDGCTAYEIEKRAIPAGHNFSNEFVVAATATGGSGHAHQCDVCGELSTVVLHTGTWVVTKAATCTTAGTETYVCPDCGYTATREIPMTDHTDENHDNVCDDCGSAICVHNMEVVSETEATCTLPGVKVEKCTECGFTRSTVTALPLSHDFSVEGEVITEPTCTEAGEMTVKCSHCDATETVAIPANGHSYINVPQKDPTCTEDGVKAHMVCTVCGHLAIGTKDCTAEELVIPATGHNFVDGSCTNCGEKDPGYTAPDTGSGNTGDNGNGGVTDPDPQPGTGDIDIPAPDVPLSGLPDDGEVEIGDVEVPLAGLMTRAEFVNYLYVQEGSPEVELSTFDDVAEDHEYAAAIGWAQANGIAKGVGNNEFAPDDLVTVEQARLFLERYARLQNIEMPELAALVGKEPDEVLDNADEVLTEFFGEAPAGQAA